jgi:hypothetical protein
MITIADALIFALLTGVAVFMWIDRGRLEMLEEEVDDLWEDQSEFIDAHNNLAQKVKEMEEGSPE